MLALTERFHHDPVGDTFMGELLAGFKTSALIEANGTLIKPGYR